MPASQRPQPRLSVAKIGDCHAFAVFMAREHRVFPARREAEDAKRFFTRCLYRLRRSVATDCEAPPHAARQAILRKVRSRTAAPYADTKAHDVGVVEQHIGFALYGTLDQSLRQFLRHVKRLRCGRSRHARSWGVAARHRNRCRAVA